MRVASLKIDRSLYHCCLINNVVIYVPVQWAEVVRGVNVTCCQTLDAKCIPTEEINLWLAASSGGKCAEFQKHHQPLTHLVSSHQYRLLSRAEHKQRLPRSRTNQTFGGIKAACKGNGGSGDDSPVESVRRDVLVDELPFPPKVHGAVQLWRHQIREVGAWVVVGKLLLAKWMHVSPVVRLLIKLAYL